MAVKVHPANPSLQSQGWFGGITSRVWAAAANSATRSYEQTYLARAKPTEKAPIILSGFEQKWRMNIFIVPKVLSQDGFSQHFQLHFKTNLSSAGR